MNRFEHYCIPVKEKPADADFVELIGVYVTDCNLHPLHFEFLYIPPENNIVPKELRTNTHIAFAVDNFDEILHESEVLLQFISPNDNVSRMAFINYHGAIVELREVPAGTL